MKTSNKYSRRQANKDKDLVEQEHIFRMVIKKNLGFYPCYIPEDPTNIPGTSPKLFPADLVQGTSCIGIVKKIIKERTTKPFP